MGLPPEVVREVDGAELVTLMVSEVEVADWACLNELTTTECKCLGLQVFRLPCISNDYQSTYHGGKKSLGH